MHYVVIAYDATDAKALERRTAVRQKHLNQAQLMFEQRKWLYACAILDEEEKIIGSVIICDFQSRNELDEWLKNEPYVIYRVWEKIDIRRAQIPTFLLDSGK